ncbi:MAG: hypothetical protein ACR2RB_09380 [Gammaproteobacteria bacterium]
MSTSMSEHLCPQSFYGFDFDDLKLWLEEEHDFLPLNHQFNVIFLQFHGWSINLYRDGTYAVEVTEGG